MITNFWLTGATFIENLLALRSHLAVSAFIFWKHLRIIIIIIIICVLFVFVLAL